MWFNNLLAFQYTLPSEDTPDWETCFAQDRLKPCPPHARFIYGWMPLYPEQFTQEVAGALRFSLGKEERILPKSVLKHILDEKITELEAQGTTVKKSQRAQMMETLEFELLPKAFCHQKRLDAFLDTHKQHLYINTPSANQAEQLLSLLRKSIQGIQIQAMTYPENLSHLFAQWVTDPHTVPAPFQLAQDCMLISPDNEKKQVNCKGYEFPAEEIMKALHQGMVTTELSLQWQERIQFTLTHQFIVKRVKCMDYLVDAFHEMHELEDTQAQDDAALALCSGEIRSLMGDLQRLGTSTRPQTAVNAPLEAILVE